VAIPSLFINRDAGYDWLIALEFGRVCDGHPSEQFRTVDGACAYMLDSPGGRRVTGFVVHKLREFDALARPRLFRGPRFDVALFGLSAATAGEIILAAQAHLGDESTTNRIFFDAAVDAEPTAAEALWRQCLECGDSMAHYGIGHTLLGAGRPRDAYGHLRYYAELAPANAWAWCSLGQACEALGELTDARAAYAQAIELDDGTDADDRLLALAAR
jgi:tetratricopeptide (TPR) repeat protein